MFSELISKIIVLSYSSIHVDLCELKALLKSAVVMSLCMQW